MDVLRALAVGGDPAQARFVLAGDAGQQIMRAAGERAEPLPAARELAPGSCTCACAATAGWRRACCAR